MRSVLITVTAEKAAGTYLSRSYPSSDIDANGMMELYRTPLYKVLIEGTTADGSKTTRAGQPSDSPPITTILPDRTHTTGRAAGSTRGFTSWRRSR